MNPISRREIKKSDVLPVSTLQYDGVELYLPANPERLLEVNYGKGWREPDPLWSFDWVFTSNRNNVVTFLYRVY